MRQREKEQGGYGGTGSERGSRGWGTEEKDERPGF
jgi:hypothetical protein